MGAVLLGAGDGDLFAARNQMALSLGWHIVLACFGVALPVMILVLHRRAIRRDDHDALELAKRWSKVSAVLFAVGAVSGTVLSFEMGLLWPGFMQVFGDVIGLPFALEGIAFFLEAIFLGIYLYGWDRLPPRRHSWMLVPIILSGAAGTFFVVAVNGWMNSPSGFVMVDGEVVDVDPWAAMFNSAAVIEFVHMFLAAFIVVGFLTGAVYAVGWLHGHHDELHRLGILVPVSFAAAAALVQPFSGHLAGQRLADEQPVKLAAMEGLVDTASGANLALGGVLVDGELRFSVEVPVPGLLSWLATGDRHAEVIGLDSVPAEDHPPVNIVRFSFQLMVAVGTALVAVSLWFWWLRWRRPGHPWGRWFLRAVVVAGPAAVVALEAGWITTEVGRQPWIAHELMRTPEAVTGAGWIGLSLAVLVVLYAAMTVAAVAVIRSMSRRWAAGEEDLQSPYGPPGPLTSEAPSGSSGSSGSR